MAIKMVHRVVVCVEGVGLHTYVQWRHAMYVCGKFVQVQTSPGL